MKDLLGGGTVIGPVPTKYWREYRLARLFGWTPAEIEAAPGYWCDWALAFSDAGLENIRRA